MLQTIRDNSKGVMAFILIGFLVLIFALSGAEALFSGSTRSGEVANVGGESITENEVTREIYRQRQQIMDQYGDSVPSEFVSDERLREPAINSLIQRKTLVQSAREQGMAVSDQMLNSIIVDIPQFAGEDGRFDSNRYQQVLRSMGYTPAQYKSVLAQEVLLNHLTLGIGNSGFVTDDELQRFAALNFQTRDFRYVTLDEERVAEEVSVSEETIESYYQENQQQFQRPEQVSVDYIDLSVDNLMENIDIDEQTLRQQYQQNQAQGETNRQRLAHILFEDADTDAVAEVQSRLEQGADFAELAEEYSDDLGSSSQGGDLGYVTGEGLPDAFMASVEQLNVGEVSGPVTTDSGVHLIKVLDERGAEESSFEEARDRIAQQLKRVEAENDFVALMERLGELSYNADSLEPVAEELGLPLENTGLFSRDRGTGIASQPEVVEAAFSDEVLNRGNSSDLLELAPDRVVVIKKMDHREAYVRPLEEVRDQIAELLRERETRRLLAERGEELRAALERGESLEQLAADADLEVHTAEDVERNDASVNRELLRHVFSLPRPEVGSPVVSSVQSGSGYSIVSLTDVTNGSFQALEESERQSLRRNLAQMSGSREYSAFREQARSEAKIKR